MRPHHERVIQRLTELFKDDPRFLALIVGGSIAKRREQENSDVDILLVAVGSKYSVYALSGRITPFPGLQTDNTRSLIYTIKTLQPAKTPPTPNGIQ